MNTSIKTETAAMRAFAILLTSVIATACSPTVKVEAPDKPIEINMNVKIEHELRIKVEQDIDQMLQQNKGLF